MRADYVDQGGTTQSLDFTAITNTTATVANAEQTVAGFDGDCVLSVGVGQPYPAKLTASSGTLTVDAGAAFVFLTGTVAGDGGGCGPQSSPASLWIVCDEGPPPTIETAAPLPTPQLPSGDYTCSSDSEIVTFYASDGTTNYAGGGGDGSLTLTQTDALATAAYRDDSFLSGSLEFAVTTAKSANLNMNQTLTAPCLVPLTPLVPPPAAPETFGVVSGSLAVNESTLLVGFNGAMDASSSCSGALKAGCLICSPK